MRGYGRLGFTRVLIVAVHVAACSSILGIEPLEEGPEEQNGSGGSAGEGRAGAPGSAGAGTAGNGGAGGFTGAAGAARGGAGGSTANRGGTSSGGSTDAGVDGGADTGTDAGAGGTPPAAGAGAGPVLEAGAGGGGEPQPPDATVAGRVIDFLGRPVAEAPVTIGNTTVLTNASGAFTIADVPDRYDAALVVTLTGGRAGRYAWVYQGLSRRDPTLQVYRGRSDVSEWVAFTIEGAEFGASSKTMLAFGSPDGTVAMGFDRAALTRSLDWYGPSATAGTLHGLRWTLSEDKLPTSFQAYAAQQFTVDSQSSADSAVTIDLADSAVDPGTVSGQITSNTTTDRKNMVFVRFSSDASIQIVDDYDAPASFTYTVPALPSSQITVAAAAGRAPGRFAVAHRDVPANESDVALVIPEPPLQVSPADDATGVTAATEFEWQRGSSGPRVSLFHVEESEFYRGVFVLTAETSVTLPTAASMALRAGVVHWWQVEAHGAWQSVDEATGPDGFQDPFGAFWENPEGPKRGAGAFALSYRSAFTTAP